MVGRLTRDVELRYTPKGTAIGSSSIAVNRKWKSESGEEKEEVVFAEFKVWGRSAETMAQYTKKGSSILLDGRLGQETWTDKQSGQKRSKLLMVVETFQFLSSSDKTEDGSKPASGGRSMDEVREGIKRTVEDESGGSIPEDDDVPF